MLYVSTTSALWARASTEEKHLFYRISQDRSRAENWQCLTSTHGAPTTTIQRPIEGAID